MNCVSRRIQKFNPLSLSKVLYLIGYGGKIHFKIIDLEFSHRLCTKDLKTSLFLVVKNISFKQCLLLVFYALYTFLRKHSFLVIIL